MTFFSNLRLPRILYHVLFWIGYFLLFGYLWADNEDYRSSYLLEFILLPVRIGAVYLSIYFLIPQYLENRKYSHFILYYILSIVGFGILQQVFIHFFYEQNNMGTLPEALAPDQVLRACVLINSTVLFLSAIKIIFMYHQEKEKNSQIENGKFLYIKSDKRFHRISANDIIYIESLGNYVTYFLKENKSIIRYSSLKEALNELDRRFLRIHKSYIINRDHVKSYNMEGVELSSGKLLPIGFSFKQEVEKNIVQV